MGHSCMATLERPGITVSMPDLFGSLLTYIGCALIMAVAQLIYATVGFGAGMFAVSLMALLLPDLTGIVVVLLVLTFITEVWVLTRSWRQVRFRLLSWLVPGLAVGLYLGTRILVSTDIGLLKQLLGILVSGMGLYFVMQGKDANDGQRPARCESRLSATASWLSLPIGLLSGTLGAMFGTGGPPVIIFFRACRLDKTAFRSTILMFFLLMSLLRAGTYATADLFTVDRILAAALLIPGSLAGTVVGTLIHDRISEDHFRRVVSMLLVVLGALLVAGAGR